MPIHVRARQGAKQFPTSRLPPQPRNNSGKTYFEKKTLTGLTVKQVVLRRGFHPWNHGQAFHELRCTTLAGGSKKWAYRPRND